MAGNGVPPYERHIFVCENLRSENHPRGSCGRKGSPELRARFKQLVAEHGLKGRVRANMAGCLDACEHGPTVVIYPDGVWYRCPTVADVEEIFRSHVLGGQVVEHLLQPTSAPSERRDDAPPAADA